MFCSACKWRDLWSLFRKNKSLFLSRPSCSAVTRRLRCERSFHVFVLFTNKKVILKFTFDMNCICNDFCGFSLTLTFHDGNFSYSFVAGCKTVALQIARSRRNIKYISCFWKLYVPNALCSTYKVMSCNMNQYAAHLSCSDESRSMIHVDRPTQDS